YYIVTDEENKVAQEVVVNPEMGDGELGELPEIGIEKEWDVASESKEVTSKELEELLAAGKVYEKAGKYYIVTDEENKVAQEVVVNPEMGDGELGELPEVGVEKEWDVASESKEVTSKELEELLAAGKAYEKAGKYYIVTDEENKVAQEVVVVDPPVTDPEEIVITNSSSSKEDGSTLVKGEDSNIKIAENVTLTVSHDNSIGAHITNSKNLTNEGKIEVSGDKSIGILADNNATAINDGVITGNSGVVEGVFEEVEIEEDGEKEVYTTYKKYDWVEGMIANSGATAINNKEITIAGSGAGMIADSANLENNGTIEVKSGDQQYLLKEFDEDGELDYTESGISKEYVAGMIGVNGSKITNGEVGKIVLVGEGNGIFVENNSEATNKGTIEVTAEEVKAKNDESENTWTEWTETIGIIADEKSTATNEGTIIVKNSGIGMIAEDESVAINNKEIYIETTLQSSSTKGMEILRNSIGENNGLIQITGEAAYVIGASVEEGGSFINGETGIIEIKGNLKSSYGIDAADDDGGKTVAINKGQILITNGNFSGIGMNGSGKETQIRNEGAININGKSSSGMSANQGATAINEGTIKVENIIDEEIDFYAGASVKGIDAHGTKIYSENGITGEIIKANVINTGSIHVVGNKGVGISVTDGDLVNSGEIVLEGKYTTALNISESGKLVNTSALNASGVGISANSFNNFDNENKIIVENEGNINVEGNGEIIKNLTDNNYNLLNAARGIDSNGGDVCNSGDIVAKGDGAYLEYETGWGTSYQTISAAKGIVAANTEEVENHGNITVEGNSANLTFGNGAIGLEVSGKSYYDSESGQNSYVKADTVNSGAISVTGDGGIGISLSNSDLVNTGKIEVTGDSAVGIYSSKAQFVSKIENEGDITIISNGGLIENKPKDAGIGILADAKNVYNSGKIEVTGNIALAPNLNGYVDYGNGIRGIVLTDSRSMDEMVKNHLELENYGDISLNGKGEMIGIQAVNTEFTNSGNITINSEAIEVDNYYP
ncbi:MAG: hypothetical protein ACRDAS_06520, partial [Cetobacterium sp.]